MEKDLHELLLRTGLLEEQKKVIENLENYPDSLDERCYNFQTDILVGSVVDVNTREEQLLSARH